MKNKVNSTQKNLEILFHTRRDEGSQKIRQNSEKWGCDSLLCILMVEFHSY